MAALRAAKSDTTSSTPEIVKSSYTPIGRVDIAAIRAQANEQQSSVTSPTGPSSSSYVGTTGYTPVQLSKPKPLPETRFGGGPIRNFGPSRPTSGTIAPMPNAPARESKAIGGASKNFATDASGKTPSQLWAERKARERGSSGGSTGVVPRVAPPPRADAKATPISPSESYNMEDSAEDMGKPVSGGVRAMKEKFARQSLEESSSLPISPGNTRPPAPTRISPPTAPTRPSMPSPPPVTMSSKPPPAKTYQSIDDVVAAGAGAGIGLGVGAMAGKAFHHDEPEPEPEPDDGDVQRPPPPPRPTAQETWDTSARPSEVEEHEEDYAVAKQQTQVHTEPEHEPEPEDHDQYHQEHEHEQSHPTSTGAQNTKSAIVLFDYEAQEENEINLEEGQIITEIEFIDDVIPYPQNTQG